MRRPLAHAEADFRQNERGVLAHFHDDLCFANKKFSIGVQAADMCLYVIQRHLRNKNDIEDLYAKVKRKVFFAGKYPAED
jgi:hypothetical protein